MERMRLTVHLRAMDHERWMLRCLQLARNGAGDVAPNPMVGAVLVQRNEILAEGWHHRHGGPHAEVECLKAFGNGPVPADAVMYVSLEPCSHTGLTPPCADLLIARGVRTVVVGCSDPDPRVAGRGIERLRNAGIHVIANVLSDRCRWQNRRFITSIEKGRPYIILKWARSSDGFLDRWPREGRTVQRISSPATDVRVHRWRSEEASIMVGSRTVINDDPHLDVRRVSGPAPLRVVLDRSGRTPSRSNVFDGSSPTLLFTSVMRPELPVEQVTIAAQEDPLTAVIDALHQRKLRSVLVEGGGELHAHFLRAGLWDEAREIVGTAVFLQGVQAPHMVKDPVRSFTSGNDAVHLYVHGEEPSSEWPW